MARRPEHFNGIRCDLCEEPFDDEREKTQIRCPKHPKSWLTIHAGCLYITTGHLELVEEDREGSGEMKYRRDADHRGARRATGPP